MGEIKLRAYNPDNNRIEYPLVIGIGMDGKFKPLINCIDGNRAYKDYPLMRYIELKDNNDVEIYEGDATIDKFGVVANIVYDNKTASFVAFSRIGRTEISKKQIQSNEVVVIGNIHQNKNLLVK